MPPSTTLEEFIADFRTLQAIFIYLPPSILLLAPSAYGCPDSTPYTLPAPSVVHRSALQPIFVHHSKPALWMSCLKKQMPWTSQIHGAIWKKCKRFFVCIQSPHFLSLPGILIEQQTQPLHNHNIKVWNVMWLRTAGNFISCKHKRVWTYRLNKKAYKFMYIYIRNII